MREMTPDIKHHNPSQNYLRGLIDKIGLSQREIASRLGVNEDQFRRYLLSPDRSSSRTAPYLLQYALECWANQSLLKDQRPRQSTYENE